MPARLRAGVVRRAGAELIRPAGLLILAILAGLTTCPPRIATPQAMPREVHLLIDEAWRGFADVFSGRLECMPSVTVVLVRRLDEDADAKYSAVDRTISILIPTSPARFPEAVVHELAHHLDASCGSETLRSDVLESQGFDQGTAWATAPDWDQIPAEHFAEAVVLAVRGERLVHTDRIGIEPETLDLIEAWGRSDSGRRFTSCRTGSLAG